MKFAYEDLSDGQFETLISLTDEPDEPDENDLDASSMGVSIHVRHR